jgi:hypothetical protein
MDKLTRGDLYTLEQYAEIRAEFRARVMAHKRMRQVGVGPHVTLQFEDRLTVQYQIQEMLRIERLFEAAAIEEELAAYNPLIPDGGNLKATMLIEYVDAEERRVALMGLVGVESRVWLCAGNGERCFAVADEDLARSTDEKTSAVHFLRFELPAPALAALQVLTTPLSMGIDHLACTVEIGPLPTAIRQALVQDLA